MICCSAAPTHYQSRSAVIFRCVGGWYCYATTAEAAATVAAAMAGDYATVSALCARTGSRVEYVLLPYR